MMDEGVFVAVIVAAVVVAVVALYLGVSWLVNPRVLDLKGKVVAITGGSSGIGLACAKVSGVGKAARPEP